MLGSDALCEGRESFVPMSPGGLRSVEATFDALRRVSTGGPFEISGDGQGSEHNGQVGVDRSLLVVEDQACHAFRTGNPEGLLDLPYPVVGAIKEFVGCAASRFVRVGGMTRSGGGVMAQ